jgi:hypothetical protein
MVILLGKVETKSGPLSARDKEPLVTGEPNGQGPISPDAGLGATKRVRRKQDSENWQPIMKPTRKTGIRNPKCYPCFHERGWGRRARKFADIFDIFYGSNAGMAYPDRDIGLR